MNQCKYKHEQGQEKVIAVCLNSNCTQKLLCCFCYADYHLSHLKDCLTIPQFLQLHKLPNLDLAE